jgi:hypothetical protein
MAITQKVLKPIVATYMLVFSNKLLMMLIHVLEKEWGYRLEFAQAWRCCSSLMDKIGFFVAHVSATPLKSGILLFLLQRAFCKVSEP